MLQKFDAKLATTSPTHAYLRTALRDIACDWWSKKTHAQIVSAETQDLKSVGHASEVCSLLMACWILNIIYTLEHPNAGDRLKAPITNVSTLISPPSRSVSVFCVQFLIYSH